MSKKIGTLRAPLDVRLWSRVEHKESGCWEWQGYCHPDRGYGQIGAGRKDWGLIETHRLAWMLHHQEEIPAGMVVRHTCDNPPCVNPWHLVLGTHADNSGDKVSRGRQAVGFMLPHTKLSEPQVREIRNRYDPQGGGTGRGGTRSNAQALADEFGISKVYVLQLVHGWFRKGVA